MKHLSFWLGTALLAACGPALAQPTNKIQVLIDGHRVYSPLASTAFWENIDVLLADIARNEVPSGPASTLYGANAVNGVINIITKNAADTQGGLAEARVSLTSGAYRTLLRCGAAPWNGGPLRVHGQAARSGGAEPVSSADLTRTGWARILMPRHKEAVA